MSVRSMGHGPWTGSPRRLSPARARVLRAVLELSEAEGPDEDHTTPAGSPAPVTLDAIAGHLGGHPNTSRQQLTALVAAGLLNVESFSTGRPGRRPQGFRITTRGRTALVELDQTVHDQAAREAAEYRDIVGAFATYLVQQGDDTAGRAHAIGQIWGARQAGAHRQQSASGPIGEPVEGLIEVLDMLGFSPSQRATPEGTAVVLRTCPLLDLAEENPDVICEMHRGMVDSVMRNFGAHQGVDLLPMADPDGCRIHLRP